MARSETKTRKSKSLVRNPGTYVAIIDNNTFVQVRAASLEEAQATVNRYHKKAASIACCKMPAIITYCTK